MKKKRMKVMDLKTKEALAFLDKASRKMTWNEVAEETGCHVSTLHRWACRKAAPTGTTRDKLISWYESKTSENGKRMDKLVKDSTAKGSPTNGRPSPAAVKLAGAIRRAIRQLIHEEVEARVEEALGEAFSQDKLDDSVRSALQRILSP